MTIKTLYIKKMVSEENMSIVIEELHKLDIAINSIGVEKVELVKPVDNNELFLVKNALLNNGFELISYKKSQHIEKIKSLIIENIHNQYEIPQYRNFSDYLSEQIGFDYSYLSNLFSTLEGTTIEKFIIRQKIEKIKGLLLNNDITLTEIASQMYYSSVQHLSNQFKKITGISPSAFKKISKKTLDHV